MRNPFLQTLRRRPELAFRYWLTAWVIVLVLASGFLRHGLWHDEHHFVETIKQFGDRYFPSLDLIRSYREMSTPLPFIMFGIIGRLFDFDLSIMRAFMLLLSAFMLVIFHRTVSRITDSPKWALAAVLVLSLNPYVFGAAICMYTDNAALLFFFAAVYCYVRKYPIGFAAFSWCAIMCRQYYVFVPLGILIYEAIRLTRKRQWKACVKAVLPPAGTILGVLPLFIFWNGLSPQTELRDIYMDPVLTFHAKTLILNFSLSFWYVWPIWYFMFRQIPVRISSVALAVPLSALFLLFPIEVTDAAKSGGVVTTGFFHRGLRWAGGEWVAQTVFFAGFMATLTFVVELARRRLRMVLNGSLAAHPFGNQLLLMLLTFHLVMPFSYHIWEKYFIPGMATQILWMACLAAGPALTTSRQSDPKESKQDSPGS